MHVLLIEDESETLEALASYLRLQGWVVYEAARELALQLDNLYARLRRLPAVAEDAVCWSLQLSQWQLLSPEGRSITLTLSEIRLLKTLACGVGQPVSRPEIIKGLEADPAYYDERRLETLGQHQRRKPACAGGVALSGA